MVRNLVFQQAGQFDVEPPAKRTAVDNQGLVLAPRGLLQGELKHGKHQIIQDQRQVHGALDVLLLKKGAFPGIDENGLVLLIIFLRLAQRNLGNNVLFAPTVNERNGIVVVNIEDHAKDDTQTDHEGIVEPGDLAQLHLVHHLFFQATIPGHQPTGQLIDDMAGQSGIIVQQPVEFFFGNLDQDGFFHGLY